MKALFLRPLQKFQLSLRGCPPLTFVIDALDECTYEPELADLIFSLAQALREPDLPVTHILLTSRFELHISEVFQNDEVRPLVREIPVRPSGEGGTSCITIIPHSRILYIDLTFRASLLCTKIASSTNKLAGIYFQFSSKQNTWHICT
jgi:hypothetical protein